MGPYEGQHVKYEGTLQVVGVQARLENRRDRCIVSIGLYRDLKPHSIRWQSRYGYLCVEKIAQVDGDAGSDEQDGIRPVAGSRRGSVRENDLLQDWLKHRAFCLD